MIKNATIEGTTCVPLLIVVLALTVAGCQTAQEKQNAAAKNFNAQRNNIYQAYLADDIDHARQDLLRLAELGEAEQQITPRGRASHLTHAYGWLFAFEERTGNAHLADVYFEKVKYWRIREAELDGDSDSEIGMELGTFTKEKITADVDEWDRGASNGKGPFYLKQIESQKTVTEQRSN